MLSFLLLLWWPWPSTSRMLTSVWSTLRFALKSQKNTIKDLKWSQQSRGTLLIASSSYTGRCVASPLRRNDDWLRVGDPQLDAGLWQLRWRQTEREVSIATFEITQFRNPQSHILSLHDETEDVRVWITSLKIKWMNQNNWRQHHSQFLAWWRWTSGLDEDRFRFRRCTTSCRSCCTHHDPTEILTSKWRCIDGNDVAIRTLTSWDSNHSAPSRQSSLRSFVRKLATFWMKTLLEECKAS